MKARHGVAVILPRVPGVEHLAYALLRCGFTRLASGLDGLAYWKAGPSAHNQLGAILHRFPDYQVQSMDWTD